MKLFSDIFIFCLISLILYLKVRISFSGAQLGKFERGRRYICNRKDEITHDLFLPLSIMTHNVSLSLCPSVGRYGYLLKLFCIHSCHHIITSLIYMANLDCISFIVEPSVQLSSISYRNVLRKFFLVG